MNIDITLISDSLTEYNYSLLMNAVGANKNINYSKPLFINFLADSALITINTYPNELITRKGILQARFQFLEALRYAYHELNTKILLLAASTKRLFGKEALERINANGEIDKYGFTLQELYPEIIFTNGDNGTAIIFNKEVEQLLKNIRFKKSYNTVLINGLGFLGTDALKHIISLNKNSKRIYVISKHTKEIENLLVDNDISIYNDINDIPKEEAHNIAGIINTTHHPQSLIDYDKIRYMQNSQPINVIDVAVPYGFPEEEYNKCKNVFRQDGGNAYIEHGLEFYFNPEICGLTENVLYGCFAEAMCIGAYLKENPDKKEYLKEFDWFNVNEKTKSFVATLFEKYGVDISPTPYNFMKKVL